MNDSQLRTLRPVRTGSAKDVCWDDFDAFTSISKTGFTYFVDLSEAMEFVKPERESLFLRKIVNLRVALPAIEADQLVTEKLLR